MIPGREGGRERGREGGREGRCIRYMYIHTCTCKSDIRLQVQVHIKCTLYMYSTCGCMPALLINCTSHTLVRAYIQLCTCTVYTCTYNVEKCMAFHNLIMNPYSIPNDVIITSCFT